MLHFLGILEGSVSDPEPDPDSIRSVDSDPDPEPDPDSIRSVDSDPDPDPGGQKCPTKIEKN
jgi:hypothetical protein